MLSSSATPRSAHRWYPWPTCSVEAAQAFAYTMAHVKIVTLVLAAALLARACQAAVDHRVTELQQLEARSKDRVIRFDEQLFNQYAATPDRPYHLAFFCTAESMLGSSKLKLQDLRREFTLVAEAFKRGEDAAKIFFVDVSFDSSRDLFKRLGIQGLPMVFHWGPSAVAKKKMTLSDSRKCGAGIQEYPWPAEELLSCFVGKSQLKADKVTRPSILTHPLFPLFAAAFVLTGAYTAWRLYNSPLLRYTALWAVGGLVVFWFSTSGGMYNIIRNVPLYIHRDGKIVWWMQGRGGQLGAEGFIMGSSYIFLSSLLSALVYIVPRISHAQLRAAVSTTLVVLSGMVAHGILEAHANKTGLRMRSFF